MEITIAKGTHKIHLINLILAYINYFVALSTV